MLLAFYFFLLGVVALTRMSSSLLERYWPSSLNEHYDFHFSLTKGTKKKEGSKLASLIFEI
jgi:hypothetical protein